MTDWGDVVARARGLTGRLLSPPVMRDLCRATGPADLAARLTALGWHLGPAADRPASPQAIELAVRRRAGARLRLLARWAGPRAGHLAPLFDDEDRRSLRAIVRGAAAGIAAGERLAGLIPTPALPLRALEQLASVADVAAVAALLTVWRHPFAPAFSTEARGPHPDLFRLDVAMTRVFAARAAAAGRRADAPLRLFVRQAIDLQNLWTAFALAEGPSDVPPHDLLVAGGAVVTADDLRLAAGARDLATLASVLRRRAAGTPLAAALDPGDHTREDAALDAMAAGFRRAALGAPLSTAPVISFVLRQRLEVRALLRLTWGLALGEPAAEIASLIGASA